MAQNKSPARLILVCFIFLMIAGIILGAYKFLTRHSEQRLFESTGSESQYSAEVRCAIDDFLGYDVLHSDPYTNLMRRQGVKVALTNDNADYDARIADLQSGKLDMAVFTVDSLITSSAKLGKWPGTIVMVIDESKGVDAICAFDGVKDIQDLDRPDARIYLTENSPSHTLARIVVASYSMPSLPDQWWVGANGSAAVLARMRADGPASKNAYVLWEPDISQALKMGAHKIISSADLEGLIIDVLVARRDFLAEHPDLVKMVVENYLRASYSINEQKAWVDLVMQQSKIKGSPLSKEDADAAVAGVEWKNTTDNYGYFRLLPPEEVGSLKSLEDCIGNINNLLVQSEAIPSNIIPGGSTSLFYTGIFQQLKAEGFHPGKKVTGVNIGLGEKDLEKAKQHQVLRALSDSEWSSLITVGQLEVENIPFRRGGTTMMGGGPEALDVLAKKMDFFPNYYLKVIGEATGDTGIDVQLAHDRAQVVVDYLKANGIASERLKAEGQKGAAKQDVRFVVGQLPF